MKPVAYNVAMQAIKHVGNSYDKEDCQSLIENCVTDCGGKMAYAGSNDMARNAIVWMGTIANAKADGKLVPGAGLMIHDDNESDLPAKYRGDGLGDFNHVGFYVGEKALYDTDKNGKKRLCNVVHSSQSMGRVAGSTLQNGWTHVVWFKEIDYGVEVQPGVSLGAEVAQSDEASAQVAPVTLRTAIVGSPDGNPVKLRPQPKKGELYWKVAVGTSVTVERTKNGYALITAVCTDGHERRAYMMESFLQYEE